MTLIEKIDTIIDFLNGGSTTWDQAKAAALEMKRTYEEVVGIVGDQLK